MESNIFISNRAALKIPGVLLSVIKAPGKVVDLPDPPFPEKQAVSR